MASEGPNSPSANTIVDSGGTAVSNPGNVYASDNAYLTGATAGSLQYLDVYRFGTLGFAIPTGATIDGVEVSWEARRQLVSGTPTTQLQSNLYDGSTRLTGPADTNGEKTSTITSNTDSTYTQGGSADTWSASPALTPAVVNSNDFSVSAICVQIFAGQVNWFVDSVTVTVYYTEAGFDDVERTATVSTAIQQLGITRTADVSASLTALGLTRDAAVSASLAFMPSRTAQVSAALQALGITRTGTVSTALQQLGITRTAAVSASLLAQRTAAVSVALKALGLTRDATVSSALQLLGITRTAAVEASLLYTLTRTAAVSISLKFVLPPARTRGVQPPEFVIVFSGPLPDSRTLVRMGLPPEVELQFGSDLPGGWSRASAGVLEPGIAQRLSAIDYQRMMLPEELDVPRFAHATIYDEGGTGYVWEGRRSSAGGIGPETRRVSMLGYGVTGLRDDVMPNGTGAARTAQVVRRAIAQSSIIEALEIDDPDVMRDWSEFGGQHISNVLESLTETGNGAARMSYTVYNRVLSFFALTPPDRPDYVIPWDSTIESGGLVEWDTDDEAIYTRVELTYTGLDGVQRQVTERNREAEDRYGVTRTLPLSGGTMTGGAAMAYARTELAQRSAGPRAVSVTRMWDRDLETLYGGREIWMVRAGEWVQVGDSGPLQPIESVTYSQVPGQGRVQLGLPISDDARSQWRRLLRLETAVRTDRNVVTRTKES